MISSLPNTLTIIIKYWKQNGERFLILVPLVLRYYNIKRDFIFLLTTLDQLNKLEELFTLVNLAKFYF